MAGFITKQDGEIVKNRFFHDLNRHISIAVLTGILACMLLFIGLDSRNTYLWPLFALLAAFFLFSFLLPLKKARKENEHKVILRGTAQRIAKGKIDTLKIKIDWLSRFQSTRYRATYSFTTQNKQEIKEKAFLEYRLVKKLGLQEE